MYVQARRYGTREDQRLVVCIAAAFPVWGTALSWLNFGALMGVLSAAGGIGLAFLFWYRLWKRGNRDNLFFFSVPAVMCGVWTYSQDHDQTVLLILLFCLYGILKNDGIWWSGKKLCISIFLFALIINPEIFALLQSRLLPLGPDLTLVYKLARYVLLILSLYVITGLKLEEMKFDG